MLGGGTVKSIHDLIREGHSIRSVAKTLGLSRNSVRKYLREPGLKNYTRKGGVSKLDAFKPYLQQRFKKDGVTNGAVLLREIQAQGYDGGCSTLKDFLKTLRAPRVPKAPTVRFETEPGGRDSSYGQACSYPSRPGAGTRLATYLHPASAQVSAVGDVEGPPPVLWAAFGLEHRRTEGAAAQARGCEGHMEEPASRARR